MQLHACIFCQIAKGQSDAAIVYRDEVVVAFRDIRPVATTHILVIPVQHIASLNELGAGDESLPGKMLRVVQELAIRENVFETGYRIIINTGRDGGQTVAHLHLHLIGGRRLHWPPG